MEENEFIPVNQSSKSTSSKKKSTRKSSKKNKPRKKGSILNKIDLEKISTVFGSFLILFSFFLAIASVSYFMTWQIDQDKIIDVSFFDFIFSGSEIKIENWLGKFGAWMSHYLIYDLFGITSFGICFLMFLFGVKSLNKKSLLPLKRTCTITISYMLWGSLFLGFFNEEISFIGGSFGFFLNDWLIQILGEIGTITLTLVILYIITTLIFNPNYSALFTYLVPKKEAKEEDESLESNMNVINPIKEEDIKEDLISETVNFDEEENKKEEELIPPILEEESSSVLIDETSHQSENGNDEFEIEVPEEEETIDADDIGEKNLADQLVEEHGEYDPKADLEGYLLPSVELLKDYGSSAVSVNKEELETNKDRIIETLSNYKIDIAKIKATVGPTVTLYEIVPAPGVRISKIKNLEDDIALSLSALGIRIIAPIPGKGTIGIEVPNSSPDMVSMRSLIASEKFQNNDGQLSVVMGKTITNETFVFDLTKMPHLLVAGATGQGKSVGLNAILISILYKKHPSQVKFVLVDPKKVELTLYNKIERHFLAKLPGEEEAIITDTSKVVNTLNSLCIEMDERYELLKDAQVRTIKEYNEKFIKRKLNPEKGHKYLPYIVVLIDEFADLIMTAGKEIEHPIARIAQLARAIGIHLIVATQRPSVNVITGMIKANFPARIAFRVLSKIDSRTILDGSGADQLIGRGDMLISTGSEMIRLQCGFVDTPEVEEICSFIGEQRAYPDALILPEYVPEGAESKGEIDMNEMDSMFVDSARIVVINQQGSASLLQRKLKLGYNRAGRIVDQLESMGIIGPFQGSKARDVLFPDIESLDELLRTKGLI